MDSFEQELKFTFLLEAKQLLDEAEVEGLALAKGSEPKERIQRLFRFTHTFKGSARAAGFGSIADLSHHLENVFENIMKGQLEITPSVCDGLLRVIDWN